MAKRRPLAPPSAAEISRIEAEIGEIRPSPRPSVAPIAQVAAESAAAFDARPATERAEAARERADGRAYREAQERGLMLLDLGCDEIDADALVRDRIELDPEAFSELKASIARNGLRLPIEVFTVQDPSEGAPRYGLLSGYRRLMALRDLFKLTGKAEYLRVRAVLRDPEAMGGAFAAMIEENEIRAGLSHFERGRIAVIAAQQGAFTNVEAAVDALFPVASKGKRSKIRSFALIYEELGDMLTFPDQLREKDGLKLAAALREGAEGALREYLALHLPQTAEEEALILSDAVQSIEKKPADPRRGGRPSNRAKRRVELSSGYVIEAEQDARGWAIRLSGRIADKELVETVITELSRMLGRA